MNIILLIMAFSLFGLSGCAPNQQQPIPHEPPGVKTNLRDYPGITPEQVLAASEKIFQLADGGNMNIKRGSLSIEAKRPFNSLVFKSFWERWKVEARPQEGSTYVIVMAELDQEGSKVSPRGVGAYNLFFARLDYLLGASRHWMTCKQYEARLVTDPTWGHDNRFLCNHAKDTVPKGPLNRTKG